MLLVVFIGLVSLYQTRHCHVEEVGQSQMAGLVRQEHYQVVAQHLIRAVTHTQQT
jgi:hemoglobin-like flavoprotein